MDCEPYTEIEQKCIESGCPNFVCWSYWGRELHSCKLQGESESICVPADDDECEAKLSHFNP